MHACLCRVQKSKKQKFPLAVGHKNETTQKPSVRGGWESPAPWARMDISQGTLGAAHVMAASALGNKPA